MSKPIFIKLKTHSENGEGEVWVNLEHLVSFMQVGEHTQVLLQGNKVLVVNDSVDDIIELLKSIAGL